MTRKALISILASIIIALIISYLLGAVFSFPQQKQVLRQKIVQELQKEGKIVSEKKSQTSGFKELYLPLPDKINEMSGAIKEIRENFVLLTPDHPFTEKVFPDQVKVLITDETIIKKIVQKTETSWGPEEVGFEDIKKDDQVIIKSKENIKEKDSFTASEIIVSSPVEPIE